MQNPQILAGAAALLITSVALAEAPAPVQTVPTTAGWEFGLSVGKTQIDSQAAAKAYIGDSADLFALNVEYYFANSPWVLNAGGGSLSYDDQQGFSQVVHDEFSGDTYSKDSTAGGTVLFFEGGANYPINSVLFIQGRVGLNTIFGSSRGIYNCDNCLEEDFDIKGGAYGTVQFGGIIRDVVEVALQYQYYLSGDLESSINLTVSSHFF